MKQYVALTLAVLLAPGLAAQQGGGGRDSMSAQSDTGEAGRLRAQIEKAFGDRVQQELKLTPDQATKLRATQERFGARRRTLMEQQMERRRALDDQMQPGIAANADSVRKLMDGMRTGRGEMLRIDQDQDREMSGYLTPVQQARFQQMREQFMRRVSEMRMQRQEGRAMRPGPRMGPVRPGIRGVPRRRGH